MRLPSPVLRHQPHPFHRLHSPDPCQGLHTCDYFVHLVHGACFVSGAAVFDTYTCFTLLALSPCTLSSRPLLAHDAKVQGPLTLAVPTGFIIAAAQPQWTRIESAANRAIYRVVIMHMHYKLDPPRSSPALMSYSVRASDGEMHSEIGRRELPRRPALLPWGK